MLYEVITDKILKLNPNYNIALYHKERILLEMKKYEESIECCNAILSEYPTNGDVLFDKACNLAMMSRVDEALDALENCTTQGSQFKIKVV